MAVATCREPDNELILTTWGVGILPKAESCQAVICGKSSAENSANYPFITFPHFTAEKFHISVIAKLPFARTVQQKCNRCIQASGVPQSLPSVFFVVRLSKNRVVFFTILINFKSLFHIPSVTSFRWSMWLASICIIDATVAPTITRIKHGAILGETAVARRLQSQLQLQQTAATIASCKCCVRGLIKLQVVSVLCLSCRMLLCLYMACRTIGEQLSSDDMIWLWF